MRQILLRPRSGPDKNRTQLCGFAFSSEFQFHPELHLSRPTSRSDTAETWRTHINYDVRLVEVRPVPEVERFPAELEVEPLVLAEARVLGDSHIALDQAWAND